MDINILCDGNYPNDGEFDSPNKSKWIVAVGVCGNVVIIERPNIHFSFFDNGLSAEDVGMPPDSDADAGVYEWICSPSYSRDWESGVVEFDGFDVISSKLISLQN